MQVATAVRNPATAVTLMECITGRRSVREYAVKPVGRETLHWLVNAAIQAPSAMNRQPWHFTIVTNAAQLDRIAFAAKSFARATMASDQHLGSILAGDSFHIFYHAPSLVVISAPPDQWMVENCTLAAQNLMLAAYAAGLGTCWIGFAQAWLGTPDGKRAIALPDSLVPVAPIIVGHPKSPAPAVPRAAAKIDWLE